MDVDIEPCRMCQSTDFEYNKLHCRFECKQCGSMQELTGVASNVVDFNPDVKYRALRSFVTVKRKRLVTKNNLNIKRLKNIKPFKLEDMFHWIYEQQVNSLKSLVTDWDKFKLVTESLWQRYLKYSGSGFQVQNSSSDDLRLKKYPLGWGVPLDPRNIDDTLNIIPAEFHRFKRTHLSKDDDLTDDELEVKKMKLTKYAKKLKIQKMVNINLYKSIIRKYNDSSDENEELPKLEVESNDEDYKNILPKLENEITEFNIKKEMYDSSESEESSLSDEDIKDFKDIYEFNDKKAENIVKIMRKKKEGNVRYVGGNAITASLMENNLILLFYSLHFSRLGKVECCCLLDIWRLAKRGIIPYLKIARFLPTDMFFIKHTVFQSIILRDKMLTFQTLKSNTYYLTETLQIKMFLKPDRGPLILRMLDDFNLPKDFCNFIHCLRSQEEQYIYKFFKVKQDSSIIEVKTSKFKMHAQHVLMPEISCLAYIFICLRMFLSFDGKYENDVSNLAKEIETDVTDLDLFIWRDWFKQSKRSPTISNSKTWQDLGKVKNARDFFEEDTRISKGLQPNLVLNDFVNDCGRFINFYKKGTVDDVLNNLIEPFEELSKNNSRKEDRSEQSKRDFRNSCVEYLINVKQYKDNFTIKYQSQLNENDKLKENVDRLTEIIAERGVAWRTLGFDMRSYPKGIFEFMKNEPTITSTENRLIDILLYNTGIDNRLFLETVEHVMRFIIKQNK